MITVASIVEGDGEVLALPVLLRRLQVWRTPEVQADILRPIRVRRDQFLNKESEFNRHLQLAAAKCGESGWILILMDADDDCPADKGAEVLKRATELAPHRRLGVVFANREYEAWFIAASSSLHGRRGFESRADDEQVDPESPRNAKGWINDRLVDGTYGETTDQPAFSHVFDLELAHHRSRSFRKLCDEWTKHAFALES
ncbi:DUF4276 family protein [Variovorax sp. dw_954]|uniref:DUF4276 family protein n=1 Tax=unclassified Variovorax TaxID=663243 RepID=UPI0031F646E0